MSINRPRARARRQRERLKVRRRAFENLQVAAAKALEPEERYNVVTLPYVYALPTDVGARRGQRVYVTGPLVFKNKPIVGVAVTVRGQVRGSSLGPHVHREDLIKVKLRRRTALGYVVTELTGTKVLLPPGSNEWNTSINWHDDAPADLVQYELEIWSPSGGEILLPAFDTHITMR